MIVTSGGLNRNSVSLGLVHNFAKLRLEVNLELANWAAIQAPIQLGTPSKNKNVIFSDIVQIDLYPYPPLGK